jgi:hypothetical protein
VLAQRDELIAAKLDPVKALRLAVAAVAPEYATAVVAKTDDVANARRIAAQKKAAAASTQQPAALRGTSDRVVDTSEHISGSVKDHVGHMGSAPAGAGQVIRIHRYCAAAVLRLAH